jgi:UDP-N-acetylmuramoyl-L-alanyl-D-glutamate--2,6-diaminopimelate ligase
MFWQIFLQICLIGFNAVFASAEIALLSLNPAKVEKDAEAGDKRAKRLLKLLQTPSRYLSMIQAGVTFAGFLGSAFAADSFARRAASFFLSLGLPFSDGAIQKVSLVLVTVIFSYVSMVLGELFPKRLAMRKAEPLSYFLSGFLNLFSMLFSPVVRMLSGTVNLLLRISGIDPNAQEETVTEEEIRLLVDRGAARGTIGKDEKQIIQNVFEFDDVVAADVMTHRLDAVLLRLKDDEKQWHKTIIESGRAFYPVCGDTFDDIAGTLSARDYLLLEDRKRENVLKKAVKDPWFVPESIKADVLFRKMKQTRAYFALVLDEYGGFSGIVTMNDLLEAITGGFDAGAASHPQAAQLCNRYKNMSIYSDFLNSGGRPTRLCYDSRDVTPGSLYFALSGLHFDGHSFIEDAIKRGASHIVHQEELERHSHGVHYLKVSDSRFAMSPIADEFFDSPSKKLTVAGVTGTEGKSTTVYLIFQLLKLCGKKAGFISTVQYSVDGNENWNTEHQTTPEAPVIHRRLSEMLQNGCEFAVIEASSHGLSPRTNRLGDVAFDCGVMTNVAHEHLEFHGTWDQYRNDKANLFRKLGETKKSFVKECFGVVNQDDPSAEYFRKTSSKKVFSFSTKGEDADISLRSITSVDSGNRWEARCSRLMSNGGRRTIINVEDALPGAFNAGNVMAALITVARLLGRSVESLSPLIPALKPVRGRMSAVKNGQNFEVFVDYAHTPSSFLAVFPSLQARASKNGGRLISVFGSAGERDTQKRPIQGEIASQYSDVIILTDEDPRNEDPLAILEEIAAGINGKEREKNLFLIPDRQSAIKKAFSMAKAGDIALLLGKGHENSIIYPTGPVPYDETACARAVLEEMGFKN